MDSLTKQAITAIRSIAVENKIAESLHRAGWELIYRATNRDDLEKMLPIYPDAIIIAAEDFLPQSNRLERKMIWVTAKTGEYELHTDLRNLAQDSAQPSDAVSPLTTKVSVVATVNSGVGGSTMAINLAYESTQSGSNTLLLDFNSDNPFLSRYFEMQRINRTFAPTPFGFTIGEIANFSQCAVKAQEANDFDHVVIDLGRIPEAREVISGQRIHDCLARWSLQSAQNLYLLARGDDLSIPELKEKSSQLRTFTPSVRMTYVFISQSPPSTKERRLLMDSARSCLSGEVFLLTRDVRNLSKARIERAPLAVVAPKSVLAHEISLLHRQALNSER